MMSAAPHIKTLDNTKNIMLDVIIALTFPLIMGVFFFGTNALLLVFVAVVSAVLFEFLYCKLLKKPTSTGDLSAVVTGMLVAFNVPATVPIWLVVVGSFFAIIIVKCLYGGIGKNFLNPALAARAFLISWPALMSVWPNPSGLFQSAASVAATAADAVTKATPLMEMKAGILPNIPIGTMFLGRVSGCIGETSTIVLIMAGLYLLIRRIITIHVPLSYIATVAVLTFIFPKNDNSRLAWMTYNLFSGGLMLGAIFMATDYATSPITRTGKVIFGIGCGMLTVFFRYFGKTPEGVTYAILIMNCCVWVIDRYLPVRRFGVKRKPFEKKKKPARPGKKEAQA